MSADRIAGLVASGIKPTDISTIVGLSPSRISQIQSTEEYSKALAVKMAELEKEDVEETALSAKYLTVEHKILDSLTATIPTAEVKDMISALRVINERNLKHHQRVNPAMNGQTVYNTIVQLGLPAHAVPEYDFSSTKEVISIDNRNLAPMSSTSVVNLFKNMEPAITQAPTEGETVYLDREGNSNEPRTSLSSAEESVAAPLPSSQIGAGALSFLKNLVGKKVESSEGSGSLPPPRVFPPSSSVAA